MFWREDQDEARFRVPDGIQDLGFRIKGRALPVDHAYDLRTAILEVLPWMAETGGAGIHAIHVAASGNGWHRPEDDGEHALLYPSHRTRLRLRLSKEHLRDALELVGVRLSLGGHTLEVGEAEARPLSALTTVFARYVVADAGESEQGFLTRMVGRVEREQGIRVRKALCGRETVFRKPDGPLVTRSLLFAEIEKDESVRLQCAGLGPHRLMGCGLFIPHKGVAPVNASVDEI